MVLAWSVEITTSFDTYMYTLYSKSLAPSTEI